MPMVLAPIIATVIGSGGIAIAGTTIAYASILANVIVAGLAVGAQYLLAQQQKSPHREPLQSVIKQASAPRFRAYGRVRTAGVVYFWDAAGPIFCMGVAIGSGRIAQVRALVIDGLETSWDGASGAITSGPLAGYASVYFSRGLLNAAPGPIIANFFPEIWGAQHLLKGIPYFEMSLSRPIDKNLRTVMPNGVPQDIKVEYDGALIYDPRAAAAQSSAPLSAEEWYNPTWAWSDNPALCILDYLRCPDGARLPLDWLDLESFREAADYCDVLITRNAAGDSEKRYRLWGIYSFEEPVRDVLARMLATCDGELRHTQDGKIAISLGRYRAPALTLNEGCIRELALEQGNGRLAAYNTVRAKFTDPNQAYQVVEGPTVQDTTALAETGVEIADEITIGMCPSPTQAHRLARRRMLKGNAKNRLSLVTDARGMLAIGEPSVGVSFHAGSILINSDFEVRGLRVSDDMASVVLELQQAVPSYYDEGYPLIDPEVNVAPARVVDIPTPTGLAASVERIVTGMGETLVAHASVTPASDISLSVEFELRPAGATTWAPMTSNGPWASVYSPIADSVVYEVHARFRDPSGEMGLETAAAMFSAASAAWAAETRAAIARMTTRPGDDRGGQIDALVRALIAAGVWAKLDALYILAAHDAQAARLNLVGTDWPLTQVGPVSFLADRGFAGDGATGYHDTAFNPTAASRRKFAQDDAHMGLWSLTDGVAAAHDMGAGNSSLAMLATTTTFQARGNSGAASGASEIGAGHLMWSRADASNVARYRDGAAHSTAAQASVALSNYAFRIGGYVASSASYSARRLAAAHWGRSLNAAESTALYNALRGYLGAIGAL